MENWCLRPATAQDAPAMMALIRELAEYERGLDKVTLTTEQLLHDGFVANPPLYGAFVATWEGRVVGLALYYYRYSTWMGKRLYLEDIIVTDSCRGNGIGEALFDACRQHGIATGCTGMLWQVLDWNEPAIRFYNKLGATLDHEWVNCHLHFPVL